MKPLPTCGQNLSSVDLGELPPAPPSSSSSSSPDTEMSVQTGPHLNTIETPSASVEGLPRILTYDDDGEDEEGGCQTMPGNCFECNDNTGKPPTTSFDGETTTTTTFGPFLVSLGTRYKRVRFAKYASIRDDLTSTEGSLPSSKQSIPPTNTTTTTSKNTPYVMSKDEQPTWWQRNHRRVLAMAAILLLLATILIIVGVTVHKARARANNNTLSSQQQQQQQQPILDTVQALPTNAPSLNSSWKASSTAPSTCIASQNELFQAVDEYLQDFTNDSSTVATTYGWPMGTWCWDQDTITDLTALFSVERNPLAQHFNEPSINRWDMSRVTSVAEFFRGSNFNQPLDRWRVRQVRNTSYMFHNARQFQQDLSGWELVRVQDMSFMFANASAFESNLCSWGPRNRATVTGMFVGTACVSHDDPNLQANPPGPFCASCAENRFVSPFKV